MLLGITSKFWKTMVNIIRIMMDTFNISSPWNWRHAAKVADACLQFQGDIVVSVPIYIHQFVIYRSDKHMNSQLITCSTLTQDHLLMADQNQMVYPSGWRTLCDKHRVFVTVKYKVQKIVINNSINIVRVIFSKHQNKSFPAYLFTCLQSEENGNSCYPPLVTVQHSLAHKPNVYPFYV